jgi:hypothetical protein
MALFKFTQAILDGRSIDVYGQGRMQRDFTYIDDIVDGILAALELPGGPRLGLRPLLLGRCLKKQGPRAGGERSPDARFQALERLKTNYEERAYWQLKAMLDPAKP